MKKLLLSAAFVVAAVAGANAQSVLSQTGGAVPTTNTIFCPISNSSGGYAGTNETSYYRSYTMATATKIVSVNVGYVVNLATGSGAPTSFPITVKLYKSNGAFPGSAPSGLTQIATVDKSLSKSQVNSQNQLIPATETITLNTPVQVAVGDIIVVEVYHGTFNGGLFLMGAIDPAGTSTGPGYIK